MKNGVLQFGCLRPLFAHPGSHPNDNAPADVSLKVGIAITYNGTGGTGDCRGQPLMNWQQQ